MKKGNKMEMKRIEIQMKLLEIQIAQKNAEISLYDSEIARKTIEIVEHQKKFDYEQNNEQDVTPGHEK
jgi:hypothetical protein